MGTCYAGGSTNPTSPQIPRKVSAQLLWPVFTCQLIASDEPSDGAWRKMFKKGMSEERPDRSGAPAVDQGLQKQYLILVPSLIYRREA